ncbi:MAG: choice-of-anchor D domain-containing protein [Candidatus Kapaibacteriales bacterium]
MKTQNLLKALFFGFLFYFVTNVNIVAGGMTKEDITEGKEFWFGIPLCWLDPVTPDGTRGEGPICIWISSKTKTTGYLEDLESGSRRPFLVQPNKITQIIFGDVLMHKPNDNEEIRNKGIHIVAEDPISVAVYISYSWTGEAFRVIPVEWLGKKYVTTNLYLDKVGTTYFRPPQILITATENNTVVRYRPTAPTGKYDAGQLSQPITLQKGQTFLILGRMENGRVQDNSSDLTGTYIEATKPISVLSGHTKGAFPRFQHTFLGRNGSFMRNMMIEMIWPIEMLGTQYVSAPVKYNDRPRDKIADDRGDMIRFVAAYDNTIIYQMRQDGTGLKQISKVLKRGEWHEITNQEVAAYYESTKPVLAAQYGKTWWISPVTPKVGNFDDPQNPPRNGQGMLIILAPLSQWTSYATFRSPQNIDNFFAVTFKVKDLPYLSIDGQKFTTKFGNAIKYIEGTDFAYLVEPIGAGDHYILGDTLPGGKEKARFAGYVYGNWDRSKDGFAYGYPIGVNYSLDCPDSLVVTDEINCGKVQGEGVALPPNSECAGIYAVVMDNENSYNYSNVKVNDNFKSGDKKVQFTLDVIDKKQPAKAIVSIQTKSGNTITRIYEYEPELIAVDPTFLDFGLLDIGQSKTMKFIVTNIGKVPVTINEFRLKNGRAEFSLQSNQLPATLQPQESREFEVVGTALELSNVPIRDSVIAVLSCYEETIVGLELITGEPIIYITDQHWDPQPVGKEVPKSVEIKNLSNLPIVITSYDYPDKVHFRVDESTLSIPLTLNAYETHTFTVFYKADVPGVVHSTRCDFVSNAKKTKTYSDWDGSGLDAGPTITGYDWSRRRVIDKFAGTDKYEGSVTIDAIGNAKVDVMQIYIDGDPDGVFSFDSKNAPLQITPNSPIQMKVWFAPKEEKEYTSYIVLVGRFSDKTLEVRGQLHGIGILPHIDITGYDFPTIMVNTESDGYATVYHITQNPLTAMDLTVFKLRLEGQDKDVFEIPDEYLNPTPPKIIKIGDKWNIPVKFKPNRPGMFYAQIIPESDAPDDVVGILTGGAYLEGIIASNYDYGTIFITTSKDGKVFATNLGSTDIQITRSINQSVSGDFNSFTITKLMINDVEVPDEPPFILKPMDTLWVYATFMPTEVKSYSMTIEYEFVTENGATGKVYSNLIGKGMVYRLIARIPKGIYSAVPGQQLDVEVKLEKHPDETKQLSEANINDLKVRIFFKSSGRLDVQDVYPNVSDCSDIITAGTLMEGWDCEYAKIIDGQTLQIHLSSTDKILKNFGTLLKFKMNTYLSDLDIVPLPVDFQVMNMPASNYVLVDTFPGDIFINPVCVNNYRLIELASNSYFISEVSPNPIESFAMISYGVAFEGFTRISVWNSLGEKVATLVEGELKAGVYDLTFNPQLLGLSSGIYHCRFESGGFSRSVTFAITK